MPVDHQRAPHLDPPHEPPSQSGAEDDRTPNASRGRESQPLRASVWSAVASAPLFVRRQRVVASGVRSAKTGSANSHPGPLPLRGGEGESLCTAKDRCATLSPIL